MSSFFSPYRHQFVRVGACVPHVAVADPRQNADNVLGLLATGDTARVALMVFPELGLSAYAIDDLLFQDAVLDEVERQLERLMSAGRSGSPRTRRLLAAIFCSPLRERRLSPSTSRSAKIYGCRSRRAPRRRSPAPRSSSTSPPAI